jgi:undecaprenyl-diphosphatase
MNEIIQFDQYALVFLNQLGSTIFDGLWLQITKQLNWTPYFILLLYLLQKKLGWKNLLWALLAIAVLITFTDQFTNLVKNHFERLRPCSEPLLMDKIRIVKASATFSFFSGHASNSMATSVFVFLLLKKYYKYAFLVFLFPLIFAYSRIYLGLHYPLDILTGYVFGATFGFLFHTLFTKLYLKYTSNR